MTEEKKQKYVNTILLYVEALVDVRNAIDSASKWLEEHSTLYVLCDGDKEVTDVQEEADFLTNELSKLAEQGTYAVDMANVLDAELVLNMFINVIKETYRIAVSVLSNRIKLIRYCKSKS